MLTTALNKGSSSKRFPFRIAASSSLLLLASAQFGCGRPFSVKTQPNLPPASYAAKATVDSVAVEAQAITDEDFLYDTFDANLISAGVLPVRVKLTNSGGEALDLKSARFEIEARAGRFKAVEARKAFKRLISYYEISAYSKSGYTESLEAFAAFALDVATPLGAGQSRQGLVFFLASSEAARQKGLTMTVGKLNSKQAGAGVSLKLN
jgi:hypothetical protein